MRASSTAWHQRLGLVRASRALVRSRFFGVLRAAVGTDDGRQIVTGAFDDLPESRPAAVRHALAESPYPGLGLAPTAHVPPAGHPIFITARFRSGSTMLWNLFRNMEGCTSYYEPFNERRWFDPAYRGTRVDDSHRHVDDYWREYEGLGALGQYYNDEWTRRGLYMDERSWNPAMAGYLRLMADRAQRRPVFQFNRVDFRLPWLRHVFPEATLVHLYRHPRDQWCSSLVDPRGSSTDCTVAHFRDRDGFYLLNWAADLKYRFPFLHVAEHEHPYRIFYFLWKLSYMFGVAYADISVRYESLVEDPARELPRLFGVLGLGDADCARLRGLIEPAESRWPSYAPDAWFRAHEESCEEQLREFFSDGRSVLSDPATETRMAPRRRANALVRS